MRTWPMTLALLLVSLAIVALAPRARARDVTAAACRISAEFVDCPTGSCGINAPRYNQLGSGTLIDVTQNGTRGLVLTCAHVLVSDAGEPATQVLVDFGGGRARHGALVLAVDRQADVALLAISSPPATVAPVALFDSEQQLVGQTFTAAGFGQQGQYQAVDGAFAGLNGNSPGQVNLVIDAVVRQGDSGGGAFDSQGRLVGVVWGCDDKVDLKTYITCGGPLRRLLARVLGARADAVLGGQSTAPAFAGDPASQAPSQGPSQCPAGCQCDGQCQGKIAALEVKLAALEARLAIAAVQPPATAPAAKPDVDAIAAQVLAKLPPLKVTQQDFYTGEVLDSGQVRLGEELTLRFGVKRDHASP